MKKKMIFGILAIILAVVASYILYYNFRAAIIRFAITAIVFPVVFYIVKPRFVWLSIGMAIMVDLLVCWSEFSYYESRGLFIGAIFVQIIIMAIIILALKLVDIKRKNKF